MMAMVPAERSKPLHNFSLPCLKWGNQRLLRCVKVSTSDDIAAVREKLMIDLKVATDNLKVSLFQEANPKPWNLRTRRAACKAPHQTDQDNININNNNNNNNSNNNKRKMDERPKFSVSLSKDEVQQDFRALLGTRPPRRPKKRPKIVQNNLDTLFPGLWLSEVTAESYKVPDVPE